MRPQLASVLALLGLVHGAWCFVTPTWMRDRSVGRSFAHARPSRVLSAQCSGAGDDDSFVVGTHVDLSEITNEQLVRIVKLETADAETNELAWRCLGYEPRGDGTWDSKNAFRAFREKYDQPPDLIGVTRTYTKEVDEPVLRANQMLHRSIPMEHKQGLKTKLRPHGFTGYKLDGLTPNMTRRAQVTNWLLYYRDALHGKTLGELKREKAEARRREQELNEKAPPTGTSEQRVV